MRTMVDKDCSNCKHKDKPWMSHEVEPRDICFDCVASDNMERWESDNKE